MHQQQRTRPSSSATSQPSVRPQFELRPPPQGSGHELKLPETQGVTNKILAPPSLCSTVALPVQGSSEDGTAHENSQEKNAEKMLLLGFLAEFRLCVKLKVRKKCLCKIGKNPATMKMTSKKKVTPPPPTSSTAIPHQTATRSAPLSFLTPMRSRTRCLKWPRRSLLSTVQGRGVKFPAWKILKKVTAISRPPPPLFGSP